MENTVATAVVDNPYGLGALWEQGDFVAKGTLIIMVIMSLTSWYVIIMKLLDQRKLMASAKLAEQKFWSAGSIREAIDRLPKNDTYRLIAEDDLRASQASRRTPDRPYRPARVDHHVAAAFGERRQQRPAGWLALARDRWLDGAVRRSLRHGLGHLPRAGGDRRIWSGVDRQGRRTRWVRR
jgi:hypothetical protein